MFLDLKQLHKALLFVCDNGLLCVAAILFLYPIHETKIEFHKGYSGKYGMKCLFIWTFDNKLNFERNTKHKSFVHDS